MKWKNYKNCLTVQTARQRLTRFLFCGKVVESQRSRYTKREIMTNYWTIKDDNGKEFYSNIQDGIKSVLLYGGTLLDKHGRLIIKVDKKDDR